MGLFDFRVVFERERGVGEFPSLAVFCSVWWELHSKRNLGHFPYIWQLGTIPLPSAFSCKCHRWQKCR